MTEPCVLFPSKFLAGPLVKEVIFGLEPGKEGRKAASLAEGLSRIGLRCTAGGAFGGFETNLTSLAFDGKF